MSARVTMNGFLMTVVLLGAGLGAGCEYDKKELDEMDKKLAPPPSKPLLEDEGPGWTSPDISKGGETWHSGNSLPRPSGDTSSDDSSRSSP
jgi:hypothetical protein